MINKIFLLTTLIILFTSVKPIKAQKQEPKEAPIYYVVFHSHGEQWIDSLPPLKQPGLEEHLQYLASLYESKQLIMSGPFLDNTGGMWIFKVNSKEEAEKIAHENPAVKNGLLNVKIKPWLVTMSTVEQQE